MTHFLRNKHNETIVDIEATKDDIHCVVDLMTYTYHIPTIGKTKRHEFIQDMSAMQEIRGLYFETQHGLTPDKLAIMKCKEMAKKWQLGYVVD
jgi:hypothetical protein